MEVVVSAGYQSHWAHVDDMDEGCDVLHRRGCCHLPSSSINGGLLCGEGCHVHC